MNISSHARVIAGMLLVLLLTPSAFCFMTPSAQTHACCTQEAMMRTATPQHCCVFAPAPAPVQPAAASVVHSVDVAGPADFTVAALPSITDHTLAPADSSPPTGVMARFPSNLRI